MGTKRVYNTFIIAVVGICVFIFGGVIYSFIYQGHLLANYPLDRLFGYFMLVAMPIMVTGLLYFRRLLIGEALGGKG